MENEVDGVNGCSWFVLNDPQSFGKETGRFWTQKKNRFQQDYIVVEIGLNIEKSQEDLSRLDDTQFQVIYRTILEVDHRRT